MEEQGKKELHKKKMVLRGRKTRKLHNRIKALKSKNLPQTEEDQFMKAMTIDFMSSEDSDSDDDTLLITRPLPWLSEEYNKVKEKLDKKYSKSLNAQGRKLRSRRQVGRPSDRPCPKKTEELAWVFA